MRAGTNRSRVVIRSDCPPHHPTIACSKPSTRSAQQLFCQLLEGPAEARRVGGVGRQQVDVHQGIGGAGPAGRGGALGAVPVAGQYLVCRVSQSQLVDGRDVRPVVAEALEMLAAAAGGLIR